MKLLVADTHFDHKPENEYRWHLFEEILAARPSEVFILGDLTHKKDWHPAVLVNRLIKELRSITSRNIPVTIIRGNHDEPLKGPPYWTFLNHITGLQFINQPTANGRLLMLPHSIDPSTEWAGIDFSLYQSIFMHQPVSGVDIGNGRIMQASNMIDLPSHIPIYSGDAHYPQHVKGIEYIGTPYPINFGEHHVHRMLLLDDNYKVVHQIKLNPIAKHSISIRSVEDLSDVYVRPGDQAKIELVIPTSRMESWPVEQAAIADWARAHGVTIAASTATVETVLNEDAESNYSFSFRPVDVLVAFADAEGIDDTLLETGYNLLEEGIAEGLS